MVTLEGQKLRDLDLQSKVSGEPRVFTLTVLVGLGLSFGRRGANE